MNILKASTIATMLLLLMSLAASAQDIHDLTVTGLIDGRDLFYITPTTLHWHHLDFAVVGRYGGANFPTGLLMDKRAPNTQYLSWIPDWPCKEWECRNEEVDSSIFQLDFPLTPHYQLTGLKVIQAPPGGSITVYQYPSADNGYTTIIDFNDDPLGGPHWYRVLLTFAKI
jgi:hypothetical protein